MHKTFEAQGAAPEFAGSTPFVEFIEAESTKWRKVIKECNIEGEG